MSVLVKSLGYYSQKGGKGGLTKIKAHLKYLEHGKVHLNEPRGFDYGRDEVTRSEFYAQLKDQPERGVIAHKLVLSLSQEERDRNDVDMRELIRETMADFEVRSGRRLQWIAFEHDDPGHPHVHVVVAGYDQDGKQVGFYPRDLTELTQAADRQLGRAAEVVRSSGLSRADRAEARLNPLRPIAPKRELTQLAQIRRVISRLVEPLRELNRGR